MLKSKCMTFALLCNTYLKSKGFGFFFQSLAPLIKFDINFESIISSWEVGYNC